ncbi:MAG: hypothetical protein OEO79_00800 [Gemmatimonadota bacterium]|nr:hypothetical protein [Gemmatimonadota bacterium]MDH3421966.1 hypothetical protein [Gemmatimonadota bacterium]
MTEGMDRIAIDVGQVLQRTVTSLYSNLVTRPTGRAVRMAIETRLQDAGERSISLIDLSEVVILDFSCADEVVARLLERSHESPTHEAFFVFRGVHEPHRDQIQTVLERRGLAAVAETRKDVFELLGQRSPAELRAWGLLEQRGLITTDEVDSLEDADDRAGLVRLVERRLAFRSPHTDRIHALSQLAKHLL